jgi:hypothetical protein
MLNKINQKDSWKYALILPALVALYCYQIETIAGKKSEQIITEPSKNR